MSISKDQVQYIASLARLKLTDDEIETYTPQLNDILTFAEELNELDTDEIEPTSHALHMSNVLRVDETKSSLPREEVFLNAPEEEEGMFVVPSIFNK